MATMALKLNFHYITVQRIVQNVHEFICELIYLF